MRVMNIALLAEDELHFALERALGGKFTILTSKSAAALIASLKDTPCKYVIIDAHIAGSSGYALAEEIHDKLKARPKIILLSNEISVGEREKSAYSGVDHLLLVPFRPEELEAILI